MKLALILIHNKGNKGNFAQIESLKPLITKVTDHHQSVNEEGDIQEFETYHYEVKDFNVPHELRCYQIFPYGVTPPSNKDDIDSYKVYYGAGDEDKTGDHPRFFNWGNKRATDYGADIVIHLEDISSLDFKSLLPKLEALNNKNDTTEFVEDSSCKVTTIKSFKEFGDVDESKDKEEAINELKEKVVDRGWKNG